MMSQVNRRERLSGSSLYLVDLVFEVRDFDDRSKSFSSGDPLDNSSETLYGFAFGSDKLAQVSLTAFNMKNCSFFAARKSYFDVFWKTDKFFDEIFQKVTDGLSVIVVSDIGR